jgi:small subunit ribosomal protein S13
MTKPNVPKKKEVGAGAAPVAKESKEDREELRGIVHLFGRDIKGQLELESALRQIKGVGMTLSRVLAEAISTKLGVSKDVQIGRLNDEQIEKMEELIKSPIQCGVPLWLLNRQKDFESGEAKHLVGTDLMFSTRQDIEREKNLYTWKGYRHAYGQPVRGQSTRTSGRKGITMGVTRSKVREAAAAAKAPEKKGAAKPAEKK